MEIKKTAAHVAVGGVIAALSCLASEFHGGIFRSVITFIGDLAVLSMFTAVFAAARDFFNPRVLDCVEISLKIAFSALCALSGDVLLHAAALLVECVFSKVWSFKEARDSEARGKNA